MRKIIIALCLILFLPVFTSFAQADNRVVLNEKLVPQAGVKITDFVPKGWKIEEELRGHLNADSLEDIVLQLIEDKPDMVVKCQVEKGISCPHVLCGYAAPYIPGHMSDQNLG